ncbi:MAG: D-alanyl-D-alanine carboxypeptidase [Clostridia bacterium]|nr:D-alanyl-D-alanine carboxypeptidase [Clostridia bacterium]
MKRWLCLAVACLVLTGTKAAALSTSAKAAAVINGDTGEVIVAQNAEERLPMASTTKIMTALLLCEEDDFEKEITVTKEMVQVEGSSMGLLPGDRVTYHDLLYGMMLASGNDAANTTAIAVGGSVEAFVKRMNEKAAALGLQNTHFVTPSGLDAEGHYTTAADLAQLAAYALQNEAFAAAAASPSARLCYGNPPYARTLQNHNKLLKMNADVVGVKTGYTKKAGRCLVSAARRDGKFVVAVTLGDPNDWQDHQRLLETGFSKITQTAYMPATASYVVPVVGGAEETMEMTVEPFVVNTVDTEGIRAEVCLPKFLYAPLTAGEPVGEIRYFLHDRPLGTVSLTAVKDIAAAEKKPVFAEQLWNHMKTVWNGMWEL